MMIRQPKSYLTLVALLLASAPAMAAQRTVYFNATGTNRTSDGLSARATSTCKITISNPSNQTEVYTIDATPTSIDEWNGAGAVAAAGTGTGGCLSGCALAPGGSVTITYSYNFFPTRSDTPNGISKRQELRCSGKITVTDQSQPGFLLASGVLVTFVESARMHTDATTTGTLSTNIFGGIAVYTQIPIPINRSKPF